MAGRRISLIGTKVSVLTFAEAMALLAERVKARRPAVFSAATVYSVMLGHDDPVFRSQVNRADVVLADGMPLVWLSRRLGERKAERINGDDFILACCADFPSWRHFLLGGREGQAEQVAAALRRRFPEIVFAGWRATPVRPPSEKESLEIVAAVRDSGAEIVWVGMGTPAQDLWMAAHREVCGRPLIGVGSAFDLLSGRKRPSPKWMKRSGLQWLHRLAQEPGRLWQRYLMHNPRFMALALRQWMFGDRGDG